MSINSALQTALAGLQATQAQIQVISTNVANTQTPGYSREVLPQDTVVIPGTTTVETGNVQRIVDQVLNTNLINQSTTANAASTLSTYYKQVENLLGQVSNGAAINNALSQFASALQAVATSPQDPVAQGAAVAAGQTLAQTLNQLSAGVQQMRQSADVAINNDVGTLNTALTSIASLNAQISQLTAEHQSTAALEDKRDEALSQVAQIVGVTSFVNGNGEMSVVTTTGQTLIDLGGARTFSYVPAGNVVATTNLSGVKLNGVDITNLLTTGSVGALLQLRDVDLPGLTAQLNQFTDNLFNATQVSQSSVALTNTGGVPASGDTFTATIDGTAYTLSGLPANPTMLDIASALNTQLGARIPVGGGAPQAGDVFTASINGTVYNTPALSGAGPFTSTDIVNALNTTLSAINIPVTVNTPVSGDQFDVTINGTTYTTAGLSGGAPYSATDIANAIQAAIPAGFTATVNGGNIEIADTTGVLRSASITAHAGISGSETFGNGVQTSTYAASLDGSGNIVISGSTGNPTSVSLAMTAGTGTETFGTAQLTTLSATAANGTIMVTDSSGNPIIASLATSPMFTAGAPNNAGTPTTIDFTQTSSSINVGQTFHVVVDGTDFGTTAPLATGATSLSGVAAAIQALFSAQGSSLTASVVAGNIEIADPSGAPISATLTLDGGPGTEVFTASPGSNPLNTTASGLGATNDKNHFFADVDIANGIDNAATITVNPSLVANTGLLLQAANGPDPTIAQNLVANLGGKYTFAPAGSFTNSITTTLGSYSSQMVGQAASTSAAADSNSTFQTQLQTQLASQAASVSGVNIDDELSNLIQYQNTYGANARVLTVVQALYNTLMNM